MKPLKHIFTKQFLLNKGIVDWGFTLSSRTDSYSHFKSWQRSQLERKDNSLPYLLDQRGDLRKDLSLVYPDYKMALCFLFSYAKEKHVQTASAFTDNRIASFATGFGGRDYHHVINQKLEEISKELKKEFSSLHLEIVSCIDTKPILERDIAYQAGLGWFGKNSMLIHPVHGSYFLIGTLLLNQDLTQSDWSKQTSFNFPKQVDHCGNCRACIDACPTGAIEDGKRQIISNLCISTFTVEVFKDQSSPEGYDEVPYIFGCDICQDVCPWNKKLLRKWIPWKMNFDYKVEEAWAEGKAFWQLIKLPAPKFLAAISSLSNRGFRKLAKGTSFERPGKIGLIKNFKKVFLNTDQ